MRLAHLTFALVTLLLLPACTSEASGNGGGETGAEPKNVATTLLETLKGIDGAEAANAAKDKLTALTDQLGKAMESVKSVAGAATDKATGGGDLANMAKDLAGKAADAFSPELKQSLTGIQEQITRLMSLDGVTAAIGPVLEKLKGLIAV